MQMPGLPHKMRLRTNPYRPPLHLDKYLQFWRINVKNIDKSPQPEAHADWQLLGELKLPANPDAASTIHTQLIEILGPLNLYADFLDKILKSAQDALQHVLTSSQVALGPGQIYLLVFAQDRPAAGPHTWGFFQIEKAENALENERPASHLIEIYLYLEG
jgi:hypothetical protein